jgi:3-hydroxymyristoyl/3-hydroxydecanoyl-(acyl carrier protein) dehydratase
MTFMKEILDVMRNIFIDSLRRIDKFNIEGSKYLSLNEDIFRDHFPNSPLLPAAMMIEGSIQLSRIYFWHITNFKNSLIPMSFSHFKFFDLVRPGNILDISLDITKGNVESYQIGDEVRIKTIGYCNDKKVFQGVIQFRIVEFEKLHNKEECGNYLSFLYENMK